MGTWFSFGDYKMTHELKDWLNSINFTKENLMEEDPNFVKEYPPFIVNKCLSGHIDSILFANEMNVNHHLDKDMQYSFYLNSLRKRKRFSPWIRKDKVQDLEYVKRYYGYSNEKALQALKILNRSQLNFIQQRLEIGGTK
jgi:hypothetical protein